MLASQKYLNIFNYKFTIYRHNIIYVYSTKMFIHKILSAD